eukprot:GFUD01089686.1.p1 GENE.GFUD01089686.1~~GFUD01089686.1.p1  ORF type:complete len:340 (+),score=72.61 GFUD01089686.1:71-1090(+)
MRKVVPFDVVPRHSEFDCVVYSEPTTQSCSRCKSINYCSKECQVSQWPKHKEICNIIKQIKKDVYDVLAKVKDKQGMFGWMEPSFVEGGPTGNMMDILFYVGKRVHYTHYLIKCGLENESKLAKELAMEHILDIFYIHEKIGAPFYELATCLLIDLERYTEIRDFEILVELARKNDSVLASLAFIAEDKCKPFKYCTNVIIGANLLKQQRVRNDVLFHSFLLGTHPRAGADSPVQKITGCSPVITKIRELWEQWCQEQMKDRLVNSMSNIEIAMDVSDKLQLPWMFPINGAFMDLRLQLEIQYKKKIAGQSLIPAAIFIHRQGELAGLNPQEYWRALDD